MLTRYRKAFASLGAAIVGTVTLVTAAAPVNWTALATIWVGVGLVFLFPNDPPVPNGSAARPAA